MKKLTLKQAETLFPVGTVIRYSAAFLRSIADYSHASACREGTICGPVKSYGPTFHIVPIKWNDEQEAGGANCSNLIVASRVHLEPA